MTDERPERTPLVGMENTTTATTTSASDGGARKNGRPGAVKYTRVKKMTRGTRKEERMMTTTNGATTTTTTTSGTEEDGVMMKEKKSTTTTTAATATATKSTTTTTTTTGKKKMTKTAKEKSEAETRGLEIVREALSGTKTTTIGGQETGAVKRTFVFKSRNKLFRNAQAEKEHRARLAKLAESRAFFDDVDGVSLAEESEEATPKRGVEMGKRIDMSPGGLIEALQGLGLVENAPELRAKFETRKEDERGSGRQSLSATTLPQGRQNAFDRVSDWVSTLPSFTPLKESSVVVVDEREKENAGAGAAVSRAEDDEASVAETEELESLADEVEKLVIDDESGSLMALLRTCEQPVENVRSMSSLIKSYVKSGVKKIGEGTYGEAYRGEGVVMKIVPMGGDTLVNGEVQMGPNEIRSETAVLKALNKLCVDEDGKNYTNGFINLRNAAVCRGPYSPKLLEAWDKYAATGETENDRPDYLPADQLYITFVCEDGGADLEHFELRSTSEAIALLFQIVVSLAVAEEECEFEHRDLHWGNVLIKRTRTRQKQARLSGVELNMQTSGLDVTIIDFTLSRVTAEDGDVYCDLNADPELFKGPKGHCQSETYRRMKRATKGKWNKFTPKTNALWVHYLADTLLEQKDFNVTAEQKKELTDFRARALDYKSARDMVFDDLFSGIWTSGKN